MMSSKYAWTAGEFRFPISVQRATSVSDDAGGAILTWSQYVALIWCAVEQQSGSEPYADSQAGRIRDKQTTRFTTWWRPDLLVTDRILYAGNLYNIRRLNNLNQLDKFLQITAEMGVEQ
jgi:SPP1 family predicted phage head-tail adaptor